MLNPWLLIVFGTATARKWTTIVPLHGLPEDNLGAAWKTEDNPLYTSSPTSAPTTLSPTSIPTLSPTSVPSQIPTKAPTEFPTQSPTSVPTVSDPYPPNPTPPNPPRWYFNYDPNSRYSRWDLAGNPPQSYWREFTDNGYGPWRGTLSARDPNRNRCSGNMQSPINVRSSGARCHEFHQIRTLPGDFGIRGDRVFKFIETNKLRLVYQRRPCADLSNVACQEPDPPHADFPNGWGGFADVTHVDFKVPAEHRLNGEQYDAEMQIFHIHPGRRRMPTQSVLMRALPNGHNAYLQRALDEFELVYDTNQARCRQRRNLRNEPRKVNDWSILNSTSTHRELQGVWDPQRLIETIHFYRYDGSLTEPPCGEFISWFVADKPMVLSFMQLEQMKRLLFTNVDENCARTSVHFNHSVARPIQPSQNRPVWQCTASHFGPDP